MIKVINPSGQFEYEIHSVIQAFFPGEEIVIETPAEGGELMSFTLPGGEVFEEEIPTGDKDELKRGVYRAFSRITGRSLPWGSLTGIRPVRLARRRLLSGLSEAEALASMKEEYLISDEKGKLAIEIAGIENGLMEGLTYGDHYSLYVDIPFCPTRCMYCSFTSNAAGKDRSLVLDYLAALKEEIKYTGELMGGRKPDTVYIGGGTPTALLPKELEDLLGVLEREFSCDRVAEYTVEAGRPDSITAEKLEVLKKHSVSRISVNPQTMNQKTLDIIGRRHSVEDVEKAFHLARDMGFDNINMDTILGLPGEDTEDCRHTFDAIKALGPDSLTIHTLAVKRASVLREYLDEAGYDSLPDTEGMMEIACEAARSMGMKPYYLYRQKNMAGNLENTGYALPGKYSLYNILINEEVQDILALGAGAISKRIDPAGNARRSANHKEVRDYISNPDIIRQKKKELFTSAL